MFWTCSCGQNNSNGLDECYACGLIRHKPQSAIEQIDIVATFELEFKQLPGAKKLKQAGFETVEQVARGITTGRIQNALPRVVARKSANDTIDYRTYLELVNLLTDAGYLESKYGYSTRIVTGSMYA